MTTAKSFNEDTSSLVDPPKVKWWVDRQRMQFKGFWFSPEFVKAVKAIETQFKPLPSDIVLASFPKTGTTWLKALTISILSQNSNKVDPLLTHNPHELIPFLEVETFGENPSKDITKMPSPRVFNTHLPCSILHDHVKESGCRIVYIARHPADTFVSLWHFFNKKFVTTVSMEEAFDEFCRGFVPAGPFFDHVLEYWNMREKENVFFITYEELKENPNKHVGKLAEFLGCSLNFEEVEEIVRKCSLGRLSNLDVNKDKENVHWSGTRFGSFFRRGIVGDWKNLVTPKMMERLHKIANQTWEGSGLEFNDMHAHES